MKLRGTLILWLTLVIGSYARAADDVVTLDPMRVDATAFGTVGISAVGRIPLWSRIKSGRDAKLQSLTITEVKEGSIAHEKGLRAKDEIVKLDGRPATELSVRDVSRIWHGKELGDTVRFEITRGEAKEPKTVDVPIQKNTPAKSPTVEAPATQPAPSPTPAAPQP